MVETTACGDVDLCLNDQKDWVSVDSFMDPRSSPG